MCRSRETINATVLATAIGINARFEADVGTLIPRDDSFGRIAKKLRRSTRSFFLAGIDIDNIRVAKIDMKSFEAIGRIARCASTSGLRRFTRVQVLAIFAVKSFPRLKIMLWHVISSLEHITLSSRRIVDLALRLGGGTIVALKISEGWSSG